MEHEAGDDAQADRRTGILTQREVDRQEGKRADRPADSRQIHISGQADRSRTMFRASSYDQSSDRGAVFSERDASTSVCFLACFQL